MSVFQGLQVRTRTSSSPGDCAAFLYCALEATGEPLTYFCCVNISTRRFKICIHCNVVPALASQRCKLRCVVPAGGGGSDSQQHVNHRACVDVGNVWMDYVVMYALMDAHRVDAHASHALRDVGVRCGVWAWGDGVVEGSSL